MNRGNMSRRGFLSRTLAGMVGAGLPAWYAQDLLAAQEPQRVRPPQANDRIVMGAIGTGTNYTRRGSGQLHGERGIGIMQDAMGQTGVQMVAVCDVDAHNKRYAANIVNQRNRNTDCQQFEDYRELLRNRDIQAVTIGTPDHWHALVAIAAMRAGKDVYCEKPLTLTLAEGKEMVRVAQQTNRVLQTGSQQRSDNRFRLACELVRNNRVGTVRRVSTFIGDNPRGGPFRVEQPPEGLNWNFWLGPTQRVDYVKERCHYEFRWWYEYSGGKMTDWGAHHNDIAQWALGMDDAGPISVAGTGQANDTRANCYNCHLGFEATYTYGNGPEGRAGTQLVCRPAPQAGWVGRDLREGRQNRAPDNGVLFEGEDNKWIFVNRGMIAASDRRLLDEPLGQGATRLPVSTNHMANFITCVRNRQQPICHVGIGHRSCSVCHIGNIAIRLGRGADRPLRWDPRQERFGDDEEANRMLSREMRAPWRLDA